MTSSDSDENLNTDELLNKYADLDNSNVDPEFNPKDAEEENSGSSDTSGDEEDDVEDTILQKKLIGKCAFVLFCFITKSIIYFLL